MELLPPLLVTVSIIVNDDMSQILLSRRGRAPYEGMWSLIGGCGAFEHMSDPLLAVKREVEADIAVDYNPVFFTYSHYTSPRPTVALYFYGTIEGEIRANPKYCKEWQWFSWENLPEEMGFDHKNIITNFRKEKLSLEAKKIALQ